MTDEKAVSEAKALDWMRAFKNEPDSGLLRSR